MRFLSLYYVLLLYPGKESFWGSTCLEDVVDVQIARKNGIIPSTLNNTWPFFSSLMHERLLEFITNKTILPF